MAERANRLSDDVPISIVAAICAPGPATSAVTSRVCKAYSVAAASSGPSAPERAPPSPTDAHPHPAETAGHRGMSGVADLQRLPLAAIGRAPDGRLVRP